MISGKQTVDQYFMVNWKAKTLIPNWTLWKKIVDTVREKMFVMKKNKNAPAYDQRNDDE